MNRRTFLQSGILAGGALFGIQGLACRSTLASSELERGAANQDGGYGPLKPRKTRNTGEQIISLPDGFEYNVLGKTGDKMADGRLTPGAHDGMAAFGVDGKVRLIRNHEVRAKKGVPMKAIGGRRETYDMTAGGGTTTLIVNPQTRELERDFVSLSGTIVNCAGGPTPWGTWISCEETTVGHIPGQVYHKDADIAKFDKDHGYAFEVSVLNDGATKAVPLKAMGRFVHEAVAVDPVTGIVYQTEDIGTAGFYRYIPNKPTRLAEGGKLQMLKVIGKDGLDTRKGMKAGEPLTCEWVDIDDPDPATATEKPLSVFNQGKAKGAATFGRLEGCWYGNGHIYMNSTDGGDAKKGQIWRYTPRGEGGELVLLFESPSADVLDAPDNLCVSPRGGLAICEDGGGSNYVRGLTVDGRVFDFAQNILNASEFAGSCFSPDGKTLFVNIQSPGLTLAIWGPWERGGF
jgi:secreted PhoX family phosphatase